MSCFHRVAISVFLLLLPVVVLGEDPLVRVVELEKPVYFQSTSDTTVQIPQGSYWVGFEDETFNLVGLDDQGEFQLQVSEETRSEPVDEITALTFAGGAELPDAHFVAVMFPDGRQLTAQGSYSGIQTRGVLSDAKKRAVSAAAATAAAAEQRARRARELTAQTAAKARVVAQNTAAAAGQVVDNVREAIPDPDLTELVAVANQLGVPEMLACLKNARSSRGGDIGNLANEFIADPTAATRSLYAEVDTAVNARMGQFTSALEAIGGDPSPAQITDAAFDLLESIAADRPALKCLMSAIEPRLPQIKQDIVRWQNSMMEEAQSVVSQTIIPAIVGDIDARIAEFALGETPTVQTRGVSDRINNSRLGNSRLAMAALRKWEQEGMASGLYMQTMLAQYDAARTVIDRELQAPNPDIAAMSEAIGATKEWINPEVQMRYAISLARYRGHKTIEYGESFIGDKIDGSERIEAFGRRIAIKVVTSVCGLIPEAGAVICNAVFVPVEAVAIFAVQKTVKLMIKTTIHTGWDLSVQQYEQFVFAHRTPQEPGLLFRGLRRLSPSELAGAAERDLPDGFRDAFRSYSLSLEQAMDRWAEGASP